MGFCGLCAALSIDKLVYTDCFYQLVHQPSLKALKQAAGGGCPLCSLIDEALNRKDDEKASSSALCEISPGPKIYVQNANEVRGVLDGIQIWTAPFESDIREIDGYAYSYTRSTQACEFEVYANEDDAAAIHGGVNGRPLPQSSGAGEDDILKFKAWLEECSKDHSCPRPDANTPLPKRIIDVGPPEHSVEPCLVEAKGMKGLYITLSHCWGGKMPLTTTSATLSGRMKGIPLESMPKTFREAIIVTRKIGLRYLWIDSLCILQDCDNDWREQSALMDEIYASSFLNIAARSSADPEGGLFFQREKEPRSVALPYISPTDGSLGTAYIRGPGYEHEVTSGTPLFKRGWVLQERLLSPRILYFGRQQLYWECMCKTYRQDGRSRAHSERDGANLKHNLDFNIRNNQSKDLDSELILGRWYNVVGEYTNRSLTYPSDRLPALSGIARALQQRTKYTYLGGLWKEDIINGLQWWCRDGRAQVINPALPSWTWARVQGHVEYRQYGASLHQGNAPDPCKFIDVSYTSAGMHDIHCDISGAELQVEGKVIEVVAGSQSHGDRGSTTPVKYVDGTLMGLAWFDNLSTSTQEPFTVHCLFLNQYGIHFGTGLALKPIKGRHPDSYTRIGLIRVDMREHAMALERVDQRVITLL